MFSMIFILSLPEKLEASLDISSHLARYYKTIDIAVYHGPTGGVEITLYNNEARFNKLYPFSDRKRALDKILNFDFAGWLST